MSVEIWSDVVCPWCAIGLASLEQALAEVGPEIGPVSLSFQPFELNPQMVPEGEEIQAHLARKYGRSPAELGQARQAIQQRAEAVGFPMRTEHRSRIWNTFDAHRLLHWAGTVGPEAQHAMKRALLVAYHSRGENPGERDVLVAAAEAAGLDGAEAAAVFDDADCFAEDVREAEAQWQNAGIQSVPRGQREAARSLGLSGWNTFRLVIFPQAIRTILPALGNQFVYVLKMSSLVSVIGLQELTRRANELNVTEYRPLEIYTMLVLEYLVLILLTSWGVRALERRMSRHQH